MAEIKFIYEGKSFVFQCTKNNKLQELFEKFVEKINLDINSIIFLHNGNKIKGELKISDLLSFEKEEKLQILVYNKEEQPSVEIDIKKYKVLEKINENLFVVFSIEDSKTYFLKIIDKNKIEEDYIFKRLEKIHGLFIDKDNKRYLNILILMKNGQKYQLLPKIKYYINNNDIWKIFILLVIEIKNLLNNNIKNVLKFEDIFIDENNIPFINYIDLVLRERNDDEINENIIKTNLEDKKYNIKSYQKSYIYSLGKIILFLLMNKDNISLVQKIEDKKLRDILSRLLCEEEKRMSLNDLFQDNIFTEKVVELNLVQEVLEAEIFLEYENRFLPSFIEEDSNFFMCDSCYSIPNILIVDKQRVILKCVKCKKSETITIQDVTNYYRNWLGNKYNCKNITSKISLKESKEYIERPINKNLKYVLRLYRLKILDKIEKVNKSIELMKQKVELEPNDKILKNLYNKTVCKILEIFFKNSNISKDIIILYSLITNTIDNMNINNSKKELYNKYLQSTEKLKDFLQIKGETPNTNAIIREEMNNFIGYKEAKISSYEDELFMSCINEEKKRLLSFADKFPKESEAIFHKYISKSFNKSQKVLSDFEKKYTYIKDTLDFTENLNKYMLIESIKNPDNFLDINETLKNYNYSTQLSSSKDNNFILALLAKFFEINGIKSYVMKKKEEKFKDIELASIQSIFSCGVLRKFELHFDFGEKRNEEILNSKTMQEKFLLDYKGKISRKLKVDSNKIILNSVKRGSVKIPLTLPEQDATIEEAILNLQLENLTEVKKTLLVDALALSYEILDPKGDRCTGWGENEKRGGEKYLPPLNGWMGIGLKVLDKYENNNWLSYNNIEGEYAVAYFGLHNFLKDQVGDIVDNIGVIKYIVNKYFQTEKNKRTGFLGLFRDNCGSGVCMFRNPEYAENFAGELKLGNNIIYKILFMCRVNPKKIRQPENHDKFWILNPTADEIRPYRILFKKIIINNSPLADNRLRVFFSPLEYIRNDILVRNELIYSKKNDNSFCQTYQNDKGDLSHLNGELLEDDLFVLRLYSSGYHRPINNYMLDETDITKFSRPELRSLVYCIQKAIINNRYPKNNINVYRGYHKIRLPDNINIGSHFYITTFISTSMKRTIAVENFLKGEGILMTINIQNNDENNPYCSDISGCSLYKDESEILLCSHCYFLVTGLRRTTKIDYIDLTCTGYSFDQNELI